MGLLRRRKTKATEARVVRPRYNNRMGYAYRCRVVPNGYWDGKFVPTEGYRVEVDRHFVGWQRLGVHDSHWIARDLEHTVYDTEEDAYAAADSWLDDMDRPPRGSFV